MPQTKSAKKTLRNQKRKSLVNKPIKDNLKLVISSAKKKTTLENLKKAIKSIDRAASKKIIPKGRAARLKSRLVRKSKRS